MSLQNVCNKMGLGEDKTASRRFLIFPNSFLLGFPTAIAQAETMRTDSMRRKMPLSHPIADGGRMRVKDGGQFGRCHPINAKAASAQIVKTFP